jgi:hypothetical protein
MLALEMSIEPRPKGKPHATLIAYEIERLGMHEDLMRFQVRALLEFCTALFTFMSPGAMHRALVSLEAGFSNKNFWAAGARILQRAQLLCCAFHAR